MCPHRLGERALQLIGMFSIFPPPSWQHPFLYWFLGGDDTATWSQQHPIFWIRVWLHISLSCHDPQRKKKREWEFIVCCFLWTRRGFSIMYWDSYWTYPCSETQHSKAFSWWNVYSRPTRVFHSCWKAYFVILAVFCRGQGAFQCATGEIWISPSSNCALRCFSSCHIITFTLYDAESKRMSLRMRRCLLLNCIFFFSLSAVCWSGSAILLFFVFALLGRAWCFFEAGGRSNRFSWFFCLGVTWECRRSSAVVTLDLGSSYAPHSKLKRN